MLPRRPADPLDESLDRSRLPDLTESLRLLEEAKAGDQRSLEELLARYQDRLQRIVRIRLSADLRRRVESMDIVQETLAAAWAHVGDLEPRSAQSILQWLSRIAENRMRDAYRSSFCEKRDVRREVGEENVPPDASARAPDERAAQRELEAVVDEAMAELPQDDREVILLRTYQGGRWEDVARHLGRPNAEAARQLYRRARVRLGRLVRRRLTHGAPAEA